MTSWGPPFNSLNFDLSSCIYVFSCSPEVRCSVGHHQRGFLTAPLWCINPENNLIELSYIAAPAPQVNFQWNLDSLSNLASISFHSLEQPQNATPPCSLPPWVLIASSHGGIPYLSMFRWSSRKLGHVVTGESLLAHYFRSPCVLVRLFVASDWRACPVTKSRYPTFLFLVQFMFRKKLALLQCYFIWVSAPWDDPENVVSYLSSKSNLSPPHSRIPHSVPNMPAHTNHYLIPPLVLSTLSSGAWPIVLRIHGDAPRPYILTRIISIPFYQQRDTRSPFSLQLQGVCL